MINHKTDLVEHQHERGIGQKLVGADGGEELERVVDPVRPRVFFQVLLPRTPSHVTRRRAHRTWAQRGRREGKKAKACAVRRQGQPEAPGEAGADGERQVTRGE